MLRIPYIPSNPFGSGLKGVGIDIGSALDLYIFMGVTISCLYTRAQDGRGYFDLKETMVDFIKDCELGLESPSFQSLPAEFIQHASNTCCASVITRHERGHY